MYFWAKITPRRIFWGKTHLYHCCLFIVSYHAWKVEKLSYSRSWNRILPKFDQESDPLILACVSLGHNQANIAHVTDIRNYFWHIWIKSKLIYSIFVPFYDAKLEKNPSGGSSDITLHNFEPQLAHNLSFCPEEGFFGKFYSSVVNFLIVPYHAEEFF